MRNSLAHNGIEVCITAQKSWRKAFVNAEHIVHYKHLSIASTTGTDTGNGYAVKIYNDGKNITRGAARLVYTRMDKNHNGIYESNEVYVFYTANHYNDFREYLNYYGGWGQIFGNETGGGILSDKYNCNPTPYVPTAYASFSVMYRED